MVGKQYGLKVLHKPSNIVRGEKWFNTEADRMAAMGGSTMERDYIYVLAERDVKPPSGKSAMEIHEALEQLEQDGHTVEYKPVVTQGTRFYHVDSIPRTEDQILEWVVDGVRPTN